MIKHFRKETLSYLAGILDGEGCLGLLHYSYSYKKNYKTPRCEVSNTDKNLINWLYKTFGGYKSPVKKLPPRKPQYRWWLRKREMLEILPLVIPYLKIKKQGATDILNYRSR